MRVACCVSIIFTCLFSIFNVGHSFMKHMSPKISQSDIGNVRLLNDDNFEHLTQATTGATTGNWLVCFLSATCSHCKSTTELLMDIAERTRLQANVAIVDARVSQLTLKRFEINSVPSCTILSHGTQYPLKFTFDKWDADYITNLLLDNYTSLKSAEIPLPPTWFETMSNDLINYLIANKLMTTENFFTFLAIITVITFCATLVLGLTGYWVLNMFRKRKSQVNIEKKRKNNDEKSNKDAENDMNIKNEEKKHK